MSRSCEVERFFATIQKGREVAIVLHDYLYDLNGVLVGHPKGRHVVDANTRSMPIGASRRSLVLTSVIVSSLTRSAARARLKRARVMRRAFGVLQPQQIGPPRLP